jgi:hypothetical protein
MTDASTAGVHIIDKTIVIVQGASVSRPAYHLRRKNKGSLSLDLVDKKMEMKKKKKEKSGNGFPLSSAVP